MSCWREACRPAAVLVLALMAAPPAPGADPASFGARPGSLVLDPGPGPGAEAAAADGPWRVVTDRVMGGVSAARMGRETRDGRECLCLHGEVSLENNGGFVQLSLDLAPDGGTLDASAYAGVELLVHGNGERYGVHLKTADLTAPWQSYRAEVRADPQWRTVRLAFADFAPHRTAAPLDTRRLRRLGLVAIGRAFSARICVAGAALYPGAP